ncbi:MAG: DUF4395 family protein, partial [Thermoanaerobaculia bacterium]|nr:DUF4395 family protein [Thermoanaerobaculia bacterium]
VLMVLMNTYGPISGIICLVCLVFLFFEAAFGICLGCKFYSLVYRKPPELCPGEVCEVKARQPIQKTSLAQVLVLVVSTAGLAVWFLVCLVVSIALTVVATVTLTETLSAKPTPLFAPEAKP